MRAEEPQGPNMARAEIDRLWRDIERIRGGDSAAGTPAAPDDGSADTDVESLEPATPMSEPAPVQAGRRPNVANGSARTVSRAELICPDGAAPANRHVRRFMHHRPVYLRQCRKYLPAWAGELAGDDWAQGKCSDAQNGV